MFLRTTPITCISLQAQLYLWVIIMYVEQERPTLCRSCITMFNISFVTYTRWHQQSRGKKQPNRCQHNLHNNLFFLSWTWPLALMTPILCGTTQDLQDTSHYVRSELLALDREQRQIDQRAAQVEEELRTIMDTGTSSHAARICHETCLILGWSFNLKSLLTNYIFLWKFVFLMGTYRQKIQVTSVTSSTGYFP